MSNLEEVIVHIPEGVPSPFNQYYLQRNGRIGQGISELLGTQSNATVSHYSEKPQLNSEAYNVLAKPTGIIPSFDATNIYGALFENGLHGSKIMLHPLVPSSTQLAPNGFDAEYAKKMEDVTLPGFSCFSIEDSISGLSILQAQGHIVRAKDPRKSDIAGQAIIHEERELREFINSHYSGIELQENGLVLEANLLNPLTFNVGFVQIGENQYCFIGKQHETKNTEGRTAYGGARLKVFKGHNIPFFMDNYLDKNLHKYAAMGHKTFSALGALGKSNGPIVSHASYDIVEGMDLAGNMISGITDPTYRVGGSTPGIVEAAKIFKEFPNINFVEVDVRLDYSPTAIARPSDILYIDHETLRITVKINPNEA